MVEHCKRWYVSWFIPLGAHHVWCNSLIVAACCYIRDDTIFNIMWWIWKLLAITRSCRHLNTCYGALYMIQRVIFHSCRHLITHWNNKYCSVLWFIRVGIESHAMEHRQYCHASYSVHVGIPPHSKTLWMLLPCVIILYRRHLIAFGVTTSAAKCHDSLISLGKSHGQTLTALCHDSALSAFNHRWCNTVNTAMCNKSHLCRRIY